MIAGELRYRVILASDGIYFGIWRMVSDRASLRQISGHGIFVMTMRVGASGFISRNKAKPAKAAKAAARARFLLHTA